MIHQIRTFYPLCGSKKYCETVDALQEHISQVVKATNEWRKLMDEEEAAELKWQQPLTVREIEDGMEVVGIDEELLPDWGKYFGEESDITPPLLRITNDKRIYPRLKVVI